MRSERAEAALLAIQLHGREAEVFLDGVSRDAFRQDRRTFHAVTRCLEIISEATRRLPEPLKARHSHLPWPIASFNAAMRARLLEACGFGWDTISPAIFGSLFQAVMKPAERRKKGAHYTTRRSPTLASADRAAA